MNPKKRWILVILGSALVSAGLGALVYLQYGKISEMHTEIGQLETDIAAGQALIQKTPELERRVIVLRESDEIVTQILPDEAYVIDFARTLRKFEEQSGVLITSLQETNLSEKGKKDFAKVGYSLQLQGNAFELLAFLDLVESSARFMSVPAFKIQASKPDLRNRSAEVLRHSITLDVITYVYEAGSVPDEVKIEGYSRKREEMLGEIARLRSELTIPEFTYRGQRGRRDPWVDPRVPAGVEGGGLTIEQQIAIVDELVQRIPAVQEAWERTQDASTVVEETLLRKELATLMAELEADSRAVTADGKLTFQPTQARFQMEVLDPLAELRAAIDGSQRMAGPSVARLEELRAAMRNHLSRGEPDLALDSYALVEPGFELIAPDDERQLMIAELQDWKHKSEAFRDFNELPIEVGGIALHEGFDPVAVINGQSVERGEMLDSGLIVREIGDEEIEFLYRGVVFVKAIGR